MAPPAADDSSDGTDLQLLGGEVASRIRSAYHKLSKSQRRLAEYVLAESGTAAVATAGRIGEEVGLSPSTVVRFALALGYSGFPELQSELQTEIFRGVTILRRLQVTSGEVAEGPSGALHHVLRNDISYLEETARLVSVSEFQQAVSVLSSSRRVYVSGMWASHAAAYLLSLGLNLIGIDCHLIGAGPRDTADELLGAGSSDAVVALALRRYPARTIVALEEATRLGLKRIAITDDPLGTIASIADLAIYVKSGEDRFFQSVTALVSAVNALVTACALTELSRSEACLAAAEAGWLKTAAYRLDSGHR